MSDIPVIETTLWDEIQGKSGPSKKRFEKVIPHALKMEREYERKRIWGLVQKNFPCECCPKSVCTRCELEMMIDPKGEG